MKNINYTITTDRLVLKPHTEADTEAIFKLTHKNEELTRYMTWDPPITVEDTRKFAKLAEKNFPEKGIIWGIHFEDQFCGIISLDNIKHMLADTRVDCATMGYWVHQDFQGRGIVTEAARRVLYFAFQELKLHKVNIGHFAPNAASKRVIEKLEFRYVGTFKKDLYKHGEWYDCLEYEMLADEYEKKKM